MDRRECVSPVMRWAVAPAATGKRDDEMQCIFLS
jgi:hypothetical protein